MKYFVKELKNTENKTNTTEANLIEVSVERWSWGVIYNDNTELHQFQDGEPDGIFHRIQEIDWSRVKMFSMYKTNDIRKRIDILVTPEMQVFHFYRNIKPFYLEGFVKVYVFGYKIKGTSETVYNFILPDDRVLVSSKDNVDLSLFELQRGLIK